MGYMCRAMGKTTIKAHHALRVNLEIFYIIYRIEMIPNQLFINLTDLVFVDFSNNNLGKAYLDFL